MQKPNLKQSANLTLSIQAGGYSKRMGRDKALLEFNNLTLIEYIIQRGKSLTNNIVITTNTPEKYAFLDLPMFSDQISLSGTLVGISTALQAANTPYVAIVACDMPFFSPALFHHEQSILKSDDLHAVVPQTEKGIEPLHAVYQRETCLAAINQSLQNEELSPKKWLQKISVKFIQDLGGFNPTHEMFMNINTPNDYQNAKDIIKRKSNMT